MQDLYQIKLDAISEMINSVSKKNMLTRKEAYQAIKEGFVIWALKKNSERKLFKAMSLCASGKYLYVEKYSSWADRLSFENFCFNVNKIQDRNERIYFMLEISPSEIEHKMNDIIKENNISFEFIGFNVFGE